MKEMLAGEHHFNRRSLVDGRVVPNVPEYRTTITLAG